MNEWRDFAEVPRDAGRYILAVDSIGKPHLIRWLMSRFFKPNGWEDNHGNHFPDETNPFTHFTLFPDPPK